MRPRVHHRHPVGDVAHQGQVVGDEQVGEAPLGLQVEQQVDDLGLDGHVEGRHRLVAHHQPGIEHQRPGDADPLKLAARQLVGQAAGLGGGEADPVEDVGGPPLRLGTRRQALDPEPLAHAVTDAPAGIERADRVLEDDLHPLPQGLHLGPAGGQHVSALEGDRAGGGLHEAQDAEADGRLAAAGLTHQSQRLARADPEADPVHRPQRRPRTGRPGRVHPVVLDEVGDLKQRGRGCGGRGGPGCATHGASTSPGARRGATPARAPARCRR